ncbi:hypothetical protein [Peribacillus frigoritolerans]|uniref:hypothetical protein n=1 Tax=Peribacillus castrilensis TaxID=2897690 RepID=UPI003DA62056
MNWNWNETTIDFPKNLKNLLNTVCRKENRFSQFEFIKWCDNLTMAFEEAEASNELGEIAFGIARDIECQWDLNTYSLKELQNLDLSKVKLPQYWFKEWLKQLNEE